jgi:hypothetical protein
MRSIRGQSTVPNTDIVPDVPIVDGDSERALATMHSNRSASTHDTPFSNLRPLVKEGSATTAMSRLQLACRRIFAISGISNLVATRTPPEDNNPLHWCIEHAFFVVVGGFEVTVEEGHEWILDDSSIVTAATLLVLAKLNKIHPVTRLTPKNRGIADHLPKALVYTQPGWTALQTIARKVGGLPITLLELNTLAYVVCAVMMYLICWKKPQSAKRR